MELDELDELENDVEQWSKDHPLRTRLQDFLEKYPDAELYDDGIPQVCCQLLGYCKTCVGEKGVCKNCWNMLVEDNE